MVARPVRAPGDTGRIRGQVVRTRPTVLQAHTRKSHGMRIEGVEEGRSFTDE